MSKRNYFLFVLALSLPAHATQITSTETNIPDVLVKAARPPAYSLTSGAITTLDHDQLVGSGVTSLSQALLNLGNIQLQDMAGNGSQVAMSMRGFGANASSNTLLLINGIPITTPDLMPPNLNAIPVNDIKAIDIIAGSESVLYGDQAVGGVINIITQQHTGNHVDGACDVGSYGLRHCYLNFDHQFRQLLLRLAGDATTTDNYRDHNHYDQQQVFGTASMGELALNYRLANENMQYPGALTAAQVRENRQQASNDRDFFRDNADFLHLQYKKSLNDNWRFQADLAHRGMNGNGVLFSPFTQSRNIYFLKPEVKANLGKTAIIGGFAVDNDQYQLNSSFGKTANTLHKYSLFSILTHALTPRLALSAGARGALQQSYLLSPSTHNTINRAVATTLGLTYQLTPLANMYVRQAGSYRFPKADENASTPPGVNGLRTQRGIAYEAGIQIERAHDNEKLGIYQLMLRDEITFDPMQTPQSPFGTNRNLPPTIRRGFTVSGKRELNSKWTANAQYNYVSAQFQHGVNEGKQIPLVSESIFRAGMNYAINEQWQLYSEAIYTSKQYPANDDSNITGGVGGYTVFNVNLHYHLKAFDASLRVNNIFNKEYYFYTVYQAPAEFFYPAPDRNVTLTIKYRFM